MEIKDKIAALHDLYVERMHIDARIAAILLEPGPAPGQKITAGGGKKPEPKPQKAKKEPKLVETRARGFTDEERQNIIELANRGESSTKLAKMFNRTPAVMATYLWKLRKDGLVGKVKRETLNSEGEEDVTTE